jgi:ABC-type transport system involved in cytochrome c biogenesis permease subunit
MAVKLTDLGILIYVVMALYLAAALAFAHRKKAAGTGLFVAGFAVAGAAFILRWVEVKHAPLQNMFEVFLCLGMLMWPISLFCRRLLGVGGEGFDAILGFIVLFAAGFKFSAAPQHLPPALKSFLFIPHVAAYMLSYVMMAKAAVPALAGLFRDRPQGDAAALDYEQSANRIARLGFPLLTLGLVLGMWWGKRAWGDYWNWDPKELWSFISWLVYVAYFHFRYMFGLRFKRANCAFLAAGLAAIVLTLLWVNLARIFSGGMHSYAS